MHSPYVNEKLWQAIHVLVTSESRLQQRLAGAAEYLIRLRPTEDLPEKPRKELEAILHSLTKEPAETDEGTIQAATAKMTDQEARRVAEAVLSLYTQLNGGI
jgi:hypothetical protein